MKAQSFDDQAAGTTDELRSAQMSYYLSFGPVSNPEHLSASICIYLWFQIRFLLKGAVR